MKPSMQALEVLAVADRDVFEAALAGIGLRVEGVVDTDPLRINIQNEQVTAIASELTEDVNEFAMPAHLIPVKKMAESYGYIVAFS